MKVKTATGKELKCEGITVNPQPPRVYLHLINIGMDDVIKNFAEELPIEGYPAFTEVQAVSSEGAARVKVSLKIRGT